MQADFDDNDGDFSVATLFNGDYQEAILLIEKLFMSLLHTRSQDCGYNHKDQSNDFSLDSVVFRPISPSKARRRNQSENVREWMYLARSEKNWTQKEVADKLGISESYYNYIEAGERQKKMDVALASKLSVVFGIPLERIVELERCE